MLRDRDHTKKGENAEQMAAVIARSVSYYDKKTGLSIKGLVYDKDGNVTTTTTTSDVKLTRASPTISSF